MISLLVNAVVGLVLGAIGTELIHNYKPELVEKIEKSAKQFVNSLSLSKSFPDNQDDEKTE